MKRIFAVSAVVVASLVLAGLAVGWLMWPSFSTAGIKQAVARDTGRSIEFKGAWLRAWPELAIELTDVELSNPAGMFEGRFAAAEAVRLNVSAASLWRRDIEVSEIAAVRPRINLVVDSEGRANFAFERSARDAGDEADAAGGADLPALIIVDGEVTYLNERSGAAFAASSVDATIPQASLDGPLELTGAFNWNNQRSAVTLYARSPARLTSDGSPTDVTISNPHLSAAFSGRAVLKDGLELAGTVDLSSHTLSDLVSWAGLAAARPAAFPPVSASGSLDLSGGAVRITGGRVTFAGMTAQGDVEVRFAGPKPHVTANLGVDRLDLELFGEHLLEEIAGTASASDWSEAPVDLRSLRILNAELSLAASEIAYGKLITGPARLAVGLTDGALEAKLVESELYGGSAVGRLLLDGSGTVASLAAAFKAEAIDGGELIAALSGRKQIRATADLEFDVAATGKSHSELVAMLNGEARLRFGQGALVELDIPALVGHLATDVADGWAAAPAGETPFTALEASFLVADGIAESEDLSLSGPVAEVAGTGSIDLLRQRLDLRLRPRTVAQGPVGQETTRELPVPVVIEGDWSAPLIYPDVEGILEDPEEAYKSLGKLIEAKAAELDFMPETNEKAPSEAAVQ